MMLQVFKVIRLGYSAFMYKTGSRLKISPKARQDGSTFLTVFYGQKNEQSIIEDSKIVTLFPS